MRDCFRLSSPTVFVLVLVLVLADPLPAQSDWEDVCPALVSASGLTAFGDSIIASCDGVIHVAGGDGLFWRPLPGDGRIGAVFAFDGLRLFAAAGNEGLYARGPGDEDFHLLNADVLPVQDLLCVGSTLYLHTREALYRSTDGGASFVHVRDASFRALLFHDGTSLYALFDRDSLRRSDDGGASWAACAYPFGWFDHYGEGSYALHRGVLYASSPKGQGLRRSTDRGRSWQQIPDLPVGDPDRHSSPGVTALASTDEQLLIHTVKGTFRSTDDGVSWETMTEGNSRLTSLFPGPACLLANTSAGLFRHESAHAGWRQIVFGQWTRYALSIDAAHRCISDGGGRFSPDEGGSWWALEQGTSLLDRPDGSLLRLRYGGSDSSWAERSVDDGRHWIFVDSLPNWTVDLAADASRLFIGSVRYTVDGYRYTIRVSGDEGTNWTERLERPSSASGASPRGLTANAHGQLLLPLGGTTCLFSPDAGVSWETRATPAADTIRAIVLTNETLFIQAPSGIWRREHDGTLRDTRLTQRIPEARLVGRWKEQLCIVGRDSLHFVHDVDNTTRSVPLPDLLAGSASAPAFAASTSCVFLTPGNSTVFRLRLQGILDVSPASMTPTGVAILGSAPHPLREHGMIHVRVDQAGTAGLDLLDLLGRTRARLHSGHLEKGEHTLQASLPAVPSGCYLLRLRSGSRTLFHPVVVKR